MKYTIRKNLHNDFKIFEENKLNPRAYFIPYSSKEKLAATSLRDERYSSDMTTCLSGEWDFKFYKSIEKLPDELVTSKVKFDKVTVPSDWQRTGHEEPVYLNCPYQIKTFEPNIPEDMPVGVYRKMFCLDKKASHYIISFLGVANNLSLYVNGEYAGYSEGSHNTAEFDITDLLADGENEILAVSFKWCNGTFLEAQDMFRDNGIFRDVLLTGFTEEYIYDYRVKTVKTANGYDLSVKINYCDRGSRVYGSLETPDGVVVAKTDAVGELFFGEVAVDEWNPEIPTVYYLYLTVADAQGKEIMTLRNVTGFRHIEIEGPVFRFNDKPVKLIGVNHHDTDLYKGYAMSLDDMERDVKLMKEFNANAVRTSHYPPDPYFITMADVYGLYVVDEADIETHGCGEMADDVSYISKQKKWITHYVDRVKRMYYRDRNHPSITMWSLGNESGGYTCHDACYDYLKSENSGIPVHYEGVCRTKRMHYDVMSEMYTDTYAIDEMIAEKRKFTLDGRNYPKLAKDYNNYPFYLCEYAHAMGVGPGNLKEYVDRFLAWEGSMGGCIWEWADHTVYHPDGDEKYKYRYTYGGDHGEKQHDGHFCVDGLMYADRTPHTGAKEMKIAYRPLRVVRCNGSTVVFENINRFRDSSYILVCWELFRNGISVAKGEIEPDIAPMSEESFSLSVETTEEYSDYYINFTCKDKTDGREISVEQVILKDDYIRKNIFKNGNMSYERKDGVIVVGFENGSVTFGGETNSPVSYIYKGKEYLCQTPEKSVFAPNLYRALIDNDAKVKDKWKKGGLDKLATVLSGSACVDYGECIEVTNTYKLKAGKSVKYEMSASFSVYAGGQISVYCSIDYVGKDAEKDLPRFGCTLELASDFEEVEYYGRGDSENMPDFNLQSPLGIYKDTVDNMFEKYVYPQESGMHCDTRYIKLAAKDGKSVEISAISTPVAFSVHHFTQSDVNKAEHQEDLERKDTTFLTLDGYTRGIGSSSCGPDTRKEYVNTDVLQHKLIFDFIPGE